jgi:hypothetical protein
MSQRAKPLLVALLLSGCMHSVHQVAEGSFEDVPRQAQLRPIEAEAEQSVFIATGNTDFADQAMQQLAARCPRGRVVGVQARHSTSLGFLVHTNRLKVTGYCLEDGDTTGELAGQ